MALYLLPKLWPLEPQVAAAEGWLCEPAEAFTVGSWSGSDVINFVPPGLPTGLDKDSSWQLLLVLSCPWGERNHRPKKLHSEPQSFALQPREEPSFCPIICLQNTMNWCQQFNSRYPHHLSHCSSSSALGLLLCQALSPAPASVCGLQQHRELCNCQSTADKASFAPCCQMIY